MKREHVPYEISHGKLAQTPREMKYDFSEPYDVWKNKALEKLKELVGMEHFEKCDDEFQIEYERDTELFHEIRFSFQSEKGYFVPGHFLIPNGAKLPNTTVICLQGHSTGMHISLGIPIYEDEEDLITQGDRDFAISCVKQGYNSVIIDQRCMGECGGTPNPDCYNSSMANILIGRTTIAERVWDVQRLIDVLEKYFPQADCNKIGCMGNSGGGTATFYSACIEERIKIAMPSCSLCTYEESIGAMRHCACNFIPSVRRFFEMGDLCGLIAPRKMIMVSGNEDTIFPIAGAKRTFNLAEKMFEAAGVPENCAWVIGDGGHRFYAEPGWKAFKEMLEKD